MNLIFLSTKFWRVGDMVEMILEVKNMGESHCKSK